MGDRVAGVPTGRGCAPTRPVAQTETRPLPDESPYLYSTCIPLTERVGLGVVWHRHTPSAVSSQQGFPLARATENHGLARTPYFPLVSLRFYDEPF